MGCRLSFARRRGSAADFLLLSLLPQPISKSEVADPGCLKSLFLDFGQSPSLEEPVISRAFDSNAKAVLAWLLPAALAPQSSASVTRPQNILA